MARIKFQRGEPVVHYSLVGPHVGYWGRKVGSFRVLASNPASLDSGPCISEKEVGHTIFPAPNEHGVYSDRHARKFVYRSSNGRDHVEAKVLQIGPEQWAHTGAYSLNTGGFAGYASPLTAGDAVATEQEATCLAVAGIFRMLMQQLDLITADSTRHAKRRKVVRTAMIALLQQVSPRLRDNIIMLVNQRSR